MYFENVMRWILTFCMIYYIVVALVWLLESAYIHPELSERRETAIFGKFNIKTLARGT